MKTKREDAQTIIDSYRFQENGVDLFGRDASELSDAQIARVLSLGAGVQYLKQLKHVEESIQNLKESL